MSGRTYIFEVTEVGHAQSGRPAGPRSVLVTCWRNRNEAPSQLQLRLPAAEAPRVGDRISVNVAWGYQ